ncbi:MAG TPA: hypothetical protein VJO52_10340 [Gemmatimonadaceae bacterium]|nr:hypothetical protein [Gemmatimonadaceae bacterium]
MRAPRITRWAAVAAALAVPALRAQDAPAAPAAQQPAAQTAPAQPPSVCGNTPNCVETNDFAAVITNFRTSDLRGYKIIDVVMHFQNKTANQLVLAYLQNSGTIIDDKGNRYIVWGGNGVRGIGQVYGGSFDPKFTLGPSGNGDAQFELAWYPGQQIYGFSFSYDLTIDEINSYQGNQHSLGGEFPLHFQNLANGISTGGPVTLANAVSAASGGAAGGGAGAGGQPCDNGGAAGTATSIANATGSQAVQGVAQQGADAVATAASAVQSVASIFSKKKNPPAKPASSPCGGAGGESAQSTTGAATSSAAGAATGAHATAAPPATTATANAAAAKTTTPPAKTATATATTPKTTAPATAPIPLSAAARTLAKKTVTPDTSKKHP